MSSSDRPTNGSNPSPEAPTNVVTLFGNRLAAKKAEAGPAGGGDDASTSKALPGDASFEEIMRKNAEVRERMRQERLKANKAVLKSYKIKT